LPVARDAAAIKVRSIQLLQALSFCHSRGIVHGDVKPANIMMEPESGVLVLIDFGHACFVRDIRRAKESTPSYQAPELSVEDRSVYSEKLDSWSAGVSIAEWFMAARLFSCKDGLECYQTVRRFFSDREFHFTQHRDSITSEDAEAFVSTMVAFEVVDREDVDQVLRDSFLADSYLEWLKLVKPDMAKANAVKALVLFGPFRESSVQRVVRFLRDCGMSAEQIAASCQTDADDLKGFLKSDLSSCSWLGANQSPPVVMKIEDDSSSTTSSPSSTPPDSVPVSPMSLSPPTTSLPVDTSIVSPSLTWEGAVQGAVT